MGGTPPRDEIERNQHGLHTELGAVVAPTLKPEPIPANIKVIMIGSSYYYELLNEYDEEFDKFFKIRADFDYEMPRTDENIERKIAQFIKRFVDRGCMEFDVSAVLRHCGIFLPGRAAG